MIFTAIKFLLFASTLAAVAYYVLCIIAAAAFFAIRRDESGELVRVTIMIPLHGTDFGAYENYVMFCRQDYPLYQIVFGVRDEQDSSVPIVRKLMADFPDKDIALVVSPEVTGQNLKVSNLRNMLEQVKHECIIIVDSDIRAPRDYLRRVAPLLSDERVGLVTCLYRAAEAPDFASRLEAIGITAEFAPGVLVARLIEGIKFALGSTMATTKTRLEAIGGFRAVGDYLADDFMLGNLMAKAGYEVRLSHCVVETRLAPVGFINMMKRQLRWGRSTRRSRPMGYIGLILTYGTALALITAIIDRGSAASLSLFGAAMLARMAMGWVIGVRWLGDRILKRHFYLLPARDIFSFVVWCLSLVGNKVEWRGRQFEIARDGKMEQVG